MGATINTARKDQYIAEVAITPTGLTSAAEFDAIKMPAGTVLDEAYVSVDALFNPTTSAVFEFGTTGATATIVASQNVFTGQALGGRAGAVTAYGRKFDAPTTIVGKYTTGGGTATTGSLRLVVKFHYVNESDFAVMK